MEPTSQHSSESPQGMMFEHDYILKTFGTILLGIILYIIIRAWVDRRKHPQQPVQQQRPSEYSSDVPSSN
jgi:membrane protein implicated in regulation of membrane protease activity